MSPTSTRLGNTPAQATSGVELLNVALGELRSRIYSASMRVGVLANQFGSPPTGGQSAPTQEPSNTNEHVAALDVALRELEAVISRIDNQ